MGNEIKMPFSNVQMELLKIYSVGVDEKTLLELKKEMARFFLNKVREGADKVWNEKGYSDNYFKNLEHD